MLSTCCHVSPKHRGSLWMCFWVFESFELLLDYIEKVEFFSGNTKETQSFRKLFIRHKFDTVFWRHTRHTKVCLAFVLWIRRRTYSVNIALRGMERTYSPYQSLNFATEVRHYAQVTFTVTVFIRHFWHSKWMSFIPQSASLKFLFFLNDFTYLLTRGIRFDKEKWTKKITE